MYLSFSTKLKTDNVVDKCIFKSKIASLDNTTIKSSLYENLNGPLSLCDKKKSSIRSMINT